MWLGLTVALAIGEIVTAGFFLLPFSIGAAAAAVLSILEVDLLWQWAAFLAVTVVSLFYFRRFAKRVSASPSIRTGSARHIGDVGTVIEDLTDTTGLVRIGREQWRAEAPGFEPLAAGTKVLVTAIVGTHLVVRPADSPES
jgi:membrane protein implicated in regulation of membrane protease activity